MLVNEGKKIIMDQGDYGLPLTMKITKNNGQIINSDTILFKIIRNNETIINKEFNGLKIDDNDILFFVFSLSKKESEKLSAGSYKYEIKAYRNDVYLNTLIENTFRVK